MSKIADRIKARSDEKRFVEVPEWGEEGKPEKVYFGPFLTGELNRIQRKHAKFFENTTMEGMVDLILLKALDENGEKLFSLEDKAVLMREEVSVVARVAAELMSSKDSDDLEKN